MLQQLTKEELKQVTDFANTIRQKQSQQGSRDYYNNDLGKNNKRMNNEIVGKVAEYGVCKYTGGNVDFSVWQTGTRGIQQFEPDIQKQKLLSYYNIHVKSTHMNYMSKLLPHIKNSDLEELKLVINKIDNVQLSWTVDKKDIIYKNPQHNDLIILTTSNENGQYCIIGGILAKDAYDQWKPCIQLQHKQAIYIKDIIHLIKPLNEFQTTNLFYSQENAFRPDLS